MNTLNALKRSPLGLDLYLWLVYRTFALRAPKRLTWRHLYCASLILNHHGIQRNIRQERRLRPILTATPQSSAR